MAATEFQFPSTTSRTAVMGRTGSGKTQAAAWVLSEAAFDKLPYVIVDYKFDELLNSIARIEEIGLNEVPKHPGLYIVHPRPVTDNEAIEAWMHKIWEKENTGLYFDEAYMVPDTGAFVSILTQGRSKHIPAIVLTQRPSWISRFVFSEANHFAVFHLNDADDRKKVRRFVPADLERRLPDYEFHWYNVDKNKLFQMRPVPDADLIREKIEARLLPKRKVY